MTKDDLLIIDGLQFVNWTRALFEEAIAGGVNAIHVTIAYWENKQEALSNISGWQDLFQDHQDLIMPVRFAEDIEIARRSGKLGIIFGFQNCSPIEDSIQNVEALYNVGVRIMQLSYNNQSLLATGCYENEDAGITRFGRKVIQEMNRVGMVIDMSHSAEKSTLQAIELSDRPIAITHANPASFHNALRNKSDIVLKSLAESGGMLGVSLYPFHLKDGSDCKLEDFCQMISDTAEAIGIDHIGLGSDLCKNWSDKKLEWMRSGKWTFAPDFGEGSAENAAWPEQPHWFASNSDFMNIAEGLSDVGFAEADIRKLMGQNWLNFFKKSFVPSDELEHART